MEVLITSETYSMVQAAKSVLVNDGYRVVVEECEDESVAKEAPFAMDTLSIIRYVRETFDQETPILILTSTSRTEA